MKSLLLLLLISTSLFSEALDFRHKDKQLHFGAGFMVSVVTTIWAYDRGYSSTGSALVGWGTGTTVGLAKELYDAYSNDGTGFSTADLVATTIGAVLGTFPSWFYETRQSPIETTHHINYKWKF